MSMNLAKQAIKDLNLGDRELEMDLMENLLNNTFGALFLEFDMPDKFLWVERMRKKGIMTARSSGAIGVRQSIWLRLCFCGQTKCASEFCLVGIPIPSKAQGQTNDVCPFTHYRLLFYY
ncbi:hypothetical protein ACH5RR_013678 [Cinchona calisaya]|uniref:Uncharacterized protein n=1 Tax=Cinchona calisaya TaxID=153742 RepID=A0ABD3A0Q3_9GENT